MIKLIRTDSANKDFINLVLELDEILKISDGDEHSFYHQFNKLDMMRYVIVAYVDGVPAGCGAIKEFSDNSAEIKRMYVKPEFRGRGIAKDVLKELETWAAELGYPECILETGKKQIEAVGLYQKSGYNVIENYGQYEGKQNSICMKKQVG